MSETFLSLWKGHVHKQTGEPVAPVLMFPRMREILDEIAFQYGVKVEDLRGPSRRKRISLIRQEAMWRMRRVRWPNGQCRYSYPLIGQFLGERDHTTIMHGVRAHQARLDAEKRDLAA